MCRHPRFRRLTPWPTWFGFVLLVGMLLPALATATGTPATGQRHVAVATTTATPGSHSSGALQTVGGTAPALADATADTWRSQAGSLLAATASAWNDLNRTERRVLLDGEVTWAPYDEIIAVDPAVADLTFPVHFYAADIRPNDEIRTDDVYLNQVVLSLPAAKLGPALAEGAKQAVIVGPDLIILVDDVVVGRIENGGSLEIEASTGTVDQLGRIAVPEPAASSPAGETAAATTSPAPTGAPPRLSASGEAIARLPVADLPVEARETIALIQAGGPFPFERDGIPFGNYEEHLPAAPFGYYREYTVITPGLDHRGARRIVAGNEGTELYYTDDHYQSFVAVVLPDE